MRATKTEPKWGWALVSIRKTLKPELYQSPEPVMVHID